MIQLLKVLLNNATVGRKMLTIIQYTHNSFKYNKIRDIDYRHSIWDTNRPFERPVTHHMELKTISIVRHQQMARHQLCLATQYCVGHTILCWSHNIVLAQWI